jgi:hypothetical protein
MTALMNRRVIARRKQKRHGPKSSTPLTQLRQRPNQQMVVDLPVHASECLDKGIGDRVWIYAENQSLQITGRPWGAYPGRRTSVRMHRARIPTRRFKGLRADRRPSFKSRATSRNCGEPEG